MSLFYNYLSSTCLVLLDYFLLLYFFFVSTINRVLNSTELNWGRKEDSEEQRILNEKL